MTTRLLFPTLCTLLLCVPCLRSNGQVLFHRLYAHGQFPPQHDQFLRLASGSTIVHGSGQYPYTGSIAKLDSDGFPIWEQRLDFDNQAGGGACVGAVLDPGNGLLLCAVQGWYPSVGGVVMLDTNGTLQWAMDAGMPITDIIRTSDGNYAAVGRRSLLVAPNDADLQVFKLDPTGAVLWTRKFQEPGNLLGFNTTEKTTYNLVEQTNGDLWCCFGYEDKVAVLALSATGTVLWSRYFASGAMHQALMFPGGHSCKLLRAAAGTWLFGKDRLTGSPDMAFAILLDTLGVPLLAHSFSGGLNTYLRDVHLGPDSTFWLFVGYREVMGPMEHALVHLDMSGSLIGTARLSDGTARVVIGFSPGPDLTYDVSRAVPDTSMSNAPRELERLSPALEAECDQLLGTMITENTMPLFSAATPTIIGVPALVPVSEPLVLTPRAVTYTPACTVTGANVPAGQGALLLYPNPTRDSFTLHLRYPWGEMQLSIRDLAGRSVPFSTAPNGTVDVSSLAPGQYVVTAHRANTHVQQAKLLKIDGQD